MKRIRSIPKVRRPDLELSLVRNIPTSTDDSRAAAVRHTQGEPEVRFEGKSNPFIDYHRNDILHALQHMRSNAHDEMTFILMTQVKELIFKALHYELHNMQMRVRADDVAGALALVGRIRRLFELLIKVWDVLSTITTHGFNEFRDHLGTSSGQQSYMYRHVEFILGNKSRRLADAHANNPDVWPAMQEALTSPSLYDDVIRLLARRGIAIPRECLERDWSEEYSRIPRSSRRGSTCTRTRARKTTSTSCRRR